jgi:hypothetical protein
MQAIETKYLGPTNSRGSRVKATCEAASYTIQWDDALDNVANHDAAARFLILKMKWDTATRGAWYRGALKGARGYVYVCSYVGERLHVQEGVR